MKRFSVFPYVLCLIIGLLSGILLPIDLLEDSTPAPPAANNTFAAMPPATTDISSESAVPSAVEPESIDFQDNFPLLNAACAVNRALQRRDYASLAAYAHPSRGVTFTPYSTVEPDSDLTFTQDQIKNLAQDQNVYTWGFVDGRGNPIKMTPAEYFQRYVYDADYTQASEIGIDRVMTGGNALENLAEAYPDCRYVDFSIPSADPVNDGLDWSSLKLVFQLEGAHWYLVGVVHGEWTT